MENERIAFGLAWKPLIIILLSSIQLQCCLARAVIANCKKVLHINSQSSAAY